MPINDPNRTLDVPTPAKPTLAIAYTLVLFTVMSIAQVAGAEWLRQQAKDARGEADVAQEKRDVIESGGIAIRALHDDTDPKLQGTKWQYVNHLQKDGSLLTLKGHTGSVYAASFSPDGKRVLTGSIDGTAKVWDAKTGGR